MSKVNSQEYIGKRNQNKTTSEWMEIIAYKNNTNVTVRFDDGTEVNTNLSQFKSGGVMNPNFERDYSYRNKSSKRIGEVHQNTHTGQLMTIIAYENARNVTVRFEDGTEIPKMAYQSIKEGTVRNPNRPVAYGHGYIGIGEYQTSKNGRHLPEYKMWSAILERCYSERFLEENQHYIGTTVCEEWLSFQNFAKWYHENHYTVGNERMHIDKDVIGKGQKYYSPEYCLIVPAYINSMMVGERKRDKSNDLPLGVRIHGCNYSSYIQVKNEYTCLGVFNTPNEAHQAYKEAREHAIKEVAEEYKDRIPTKVYEALLAYEV